MSTDARPQSGNPELGQCPNCGAAKHPGPECPQCGVIYAKAEEKIRRSAKSSAETDANMDQDVEKLTQCPACSRDISKKAATCPHCGEPLEQEQKTAVTSPETSAKRNNTGIGCLVFIVLMGIIAAISNHGDTGKSSTAEISNSNKPPVNRIVIVTRDEYGNKWPYTIPKGQLLCIRRYVHPYLKKDVTITYEGKTYAINGSAMGQKEYLPLELILRDNPDFPGMRIPDPGIIQRGLELCD